MNEKSKRMFKEIKKIENDYGIKELTEEKFESLLLKLISNDDLSKISGGASNTKRSAAFLAALLNLNGVAETAYGQNHPAINSVPMHSVAHDKRDKDKKQHKGKKIALASIPAALTILGLGYKYFSKQKKHSNDNYKEHSNDNYEGYIECDESKIEKILKDISDKKFLVIDCDIYSEGPPFTLDQDYLCKRKVNECKFKPLYIVKYKIDDNKLKLVLSDKKDTLEKDTKYKLEENTLEEGILSNKEFKSVSIIPSKFSIEVTDYNVYTLENDYEIYKYKVYKKGTKLFKEDFILKCSVFNGLRLAYHTFYEKENIGKQFDFYMDRMFQDIESFRTWKDDYKCVLYAFYGKFKYLYEQLPDNSEYLESPQFIDTPPGKYKLKDNIYNYLCEHTKSIKTEAPSKINENLYEEASFKKAIEKFEKPSESHYQESDFTSFKQRGFVPANLAVAALKDKVLEHSYNIQMVASQLNCQESVNDSFSAMFMQFFDKSQGPSARSDDPDSFARSVSDEQSGENRPRITEKLIEQIKEQFNKSEQLIDRQKKDFDKSQKDIKYLEEALSRCSSDDESYKKSITARIKRIKHKIIVDPYEYIYKNGYLKIYNAEKDEDAKKDGDKKKLVKLIGKYPADNYCTQEVKSKGKNIEYKLAFISAASYQKHPDRGLKDYITNFLLLYPQFENNFLDAINTAETKKGKRVIDHLTGVGQGFFSNPVGLDKLIIYLLARKYAHHIANGNLLFMLHQCINYENLDSIFGKDGEKAPKKIQELAQSVIIDADKYGYGDVITELGNLCEENKKLSYDQAITELQSTFGKEVDLPKALFDIVKVFGDIGGSQPNESDADTVSNDPGDIRESQSHENDAAAVSDSFCNIQ